MRMYLPAVQQLLKGRSRPTPADPSFIEAVIGKNRGSAKVRFAGPIPKAAPSHGFPLAERLPIGGNMMRTSE